MVLPTPLAAIHLPEVLLMVQLCPRPPVPEGQGPGGGQGRGERGVAWASSRVSCPQPLLGPDRMSDWLEGAAGHAMPSGRAIVDHTKDGAWQGRGQPSSGQRSGREDASLPAHTLPAGAGPFVPAVDVASEQRPGLSLPGAPRGDFSPCPPRIFG